ncbi:MAG: hypothetical protein RLZZ519_1826 [Bacteroidota bacterium]|jgi:tetratricopeptide (TPR) repeat protein
MNLSIFVFYLSICLSYLLIRPLATLMHEAGHLCFLLLTGHRGEIKVFLGSVGEGKGAWRIPTGRILWIVHPSGMLMRGSISDFQKALTNSQIIPYALSGPVFSLLMAASAGFLAFGNLTANVSWLKTFLILAALIPAIDFLLALFYTYSPILHSSESVFGNDGQLIAWRMRFGKQTQTYLHGWWLFEMERYAEAAQSFSEVHNNGCRDKELLEHLIFCALMLGKFEEVLQWDAEMSALHTSDAFDACRRATALDALGDRNAARIALDQALRSTPGHHEALNHRAFFDISEGKLIEAAKDLEKSIRANREFAVAYSNLAWIHLLQSDSEKAYPHLMQSMKLEYENPALHRNWAMYFWIQRDAAAAAEAIERAQLLGLDATECTEWRFKIAALREN